MVTIEKLNEFAMMPTYATEGSACFDLHAAEEKIIRAGMQDIIGTGLAFEIPEGHVMLVFSRSGHALRSRVSLGNCVGVVDSDYRGEVRVVIRNDGLHYFDIMRGDRIAQAMIVPVAPVKISVGKVNATARGANGFGSTGK